MWGALSRSFIILYLSVLKGDNNTAYLAPNLTFALVESNWDQHMPFSPGGRECLGHVLLGLNWVVIKKRKTLLLGWWIPGSPSKVMLCPTVFRIATLSLRRSKQVLSLTLFRILQMSHLAKVLRATCIQLVWLPSCRSLGNLPFPVLIAQMPSRKPHAHELLVTLALPYSALTVGPSDTFGIINLWIMATETDYTKN